MIKTKVHCDCCNGEMTHTDTPIAVGTGVVYIYGGILDRRMADMCTECRESFLEWWKSREKTEPV